MSNLLLQDHLRAISDNLGFMLAFKKVNTDVFTGLTLCRYRPRRQL